MRHEARYSISASQLNLFQTAMLLKSVQMQANVMCKHRSNLQQAQVPETGQRQNNIYIPVDLQRAVQSDCKE